MSLNISVRKLSDLRAEDFYLADQHLLSTLFGNQICFSGQTNQFNNWFNEARNLELSGENLRFLLWHESDLGETASACVHVERSAADPAVAVMSCSGLAECMCSGLMTAVCLTAINHSFDSGFTESIVANADLEDYMRNKLFTSIPMRQSPSRESVSREILLKSGVNYSIENGDPIRSSWDINAILNDAHHRFRAGLEIVGMEKVLMNNHFKECSQTIM